MIASYTKKHFRVDTFSAGGKGGQHQNKTQSGVRITHLPSGLSAESRVHKEQPRNKKEAFMKLAEKVKQWHIGLEASIKDKRSQEVVRTYHAVDNRVKDHLSGFTQPYKAVLEDIGPMIENRITFLNNTENE